MEINTGRQKAFMPHSLEHTYTSNTREDEILRLSPLDGSI